MLRGSPQVLWKTFLLFRCLGLFSSALIRLRLKFTVLLEENFYFSFCFFQLFAAGCGKLDTFFKEFQCLLKGHIALLKFVHNLFQTLKTIFKLRHWAETPWKTL